MLTRYPKARYTPAAPTNIGGTMEHDRVRLFVVHIAQGNYQRGIIAWFRNPRALVSSHFSVSRYGRICQHVELDRIAWAEEDYNDVAISIEHLGYSGMKLTILQKRATLRLLVWLHGQYPQVPLHRIASPSGRGVIGHGELGVAGGDHPDCPGAPILAQLTTALTPKVRTRTKSLR